MALINHRTHEIHFKIVYYGPGLCGKTTNLRALHDRLPPERCGKMISIATDHERTLFFDFLPIDLGQVNGFLTRFHLYTVPGQVYYRLSRRAVLQGVDGLVFVADSHPSREAANRESLIDLNDHLRTIGVTGQALARIPWVFQWNKRDSPVAVPLERLRKALNPQGWPEFEAVASDGRGVSETLRSACKAVLARLGSGHAPTAASPTAPIPVPHASMPQRTTSAPQAVAITSPTAIAVATVPPTAIATVPEAPVAPPRLAPFGAGTTVAPPMAPPALAPVRTAPPAIASTSPEPERTAPPAIAWPLPSAPRTP